MNLVSESKRGTVVLAFVAAVVPALAQKTPEPWVAPKQERARANPLARSEEALRTGRALYRQHCAICHGETGKGDGPEARQHARRTHRAPKDLTAPEVQADLTDGEIFWKASTGLREDGRVVMPGYRGQIRDADTWGIVHFLRSLPAEQKVRR